jgi:hypothetical protein
MPERTFTLNSPTFAILCEKNQRSLVTLPAKALVALVVGDLDSDGFVKVRYHDKLLEMFAVDLRERGARTLKHSA